MSYSARSLERVAKNIAQKIEDELDRVGIFHRTFYRCKSELSVDSKIAKKNYDGVNSFLRDIIGIRSNLYFVDDVEIIYPFFKKYFELIEETRDVNVETEFKPTRLNLVFKIINEFQKEFTELIQDTRIDSSFEFQIRTVLSEGWHEVDHDMRYKYKSDWDYQQDMSRMLNGVLAGLESSDWTMVQIFETLSYRHYKNKAVESMIRAKFRIRIKSGEFDSKINDALILDDDLRRSLFKINRQDFLIRFLQSNVIMPLTMNNIVFFLNYVFLKNTKLNELTPLQLLKEFESSNIE